MVSGACKSLIGGFGNEGGQTLSNDPHSMEPFFIGPDGKRVTLADLPPRDLLNLTSPQKSMVVAAVRHGLIAISEACECFHLSLDEYLDWHRSFAGEASGECP